MFLPVVTVFTEARNKCQIDRLFSREKHKCQIGCNYVKLNIDSKLVLLLGIEYALIEVLQP